MPAQTTPGTESIPIFAFAAGLGPLAAVATDPARGIVLGLVAWVALSAGAGGLAALRPLSPPWFLLPLLLLLSGIASFLCSLLIQLVWPAMGTVLLPHLPLTAACSAVLLGARELALQSGPGLAIYGALRAGVWIPICLGLAGAFCALLDPAQSLFSAQDWLATSTGRFPAASLFALGLILGLCQAWWRPLEAEPRRSPQ